MLLSSLPFGEPRLSEAVDSPVSRGVVEIPFSHLTRWKGKKGTLFSSSAFPRPDAGSPAVEHLAT